jgi:ADP-dependent NAD(P)H-hydrate dehydratase / NAD(P)H-hydrate epimerase
MNPHIIEQDRVARLLPSRPKDSHKGMYGTVLVIGGAAGMTGAALLASRAALKMGAGAVHAMLLCDDAPAVDFMQPELMLHGAPSALPFATVVLAGCGMGKDVLAQKLLAKVLHSDAILVLDADALNLISMHDELRRLLVARKKPAVITPHPAEAARLLSCTTAEVQKDRISAVRQLVNTFGCVAVLKGADSLCALPDGRLFVNKTGNPGMSAPGMGDVLAGMIAAFIAQGLRIEDALIFAVHLHGAAGDELAKKHAVGMTATELTDQARILLNQWAIA